MRERVQAYVYAHVYACAGICVRARAHLMRMCVRVQAYVCALVRTLCLPACMCMYMYLYV
jgi:hypothetical protein